MRLVLTACLYPGGMLDGSASREPSRCEACHLPSAAARRLHATFDWANSPPDLWINCGDWIYVDATAGLFDPAALDLALADAYQGRQKEHWLHKLQEELNFHPQPLIDDHEIADNWEPSNNKGQAIKLRKAMVEAREAFLNEHQGNVQEKRRSRGVLWVDDTFDGHDFFFGDTRTERSRRDPRSLYRATMMKSPQRRALRKWLSQSATDNPNRYRFIATPSILLPRKLATAEGDTVNPAAALRSDAWDGYPASLHSLLAFIADNPIANCVFLSGDEHLGCVAEVTVRRLTPPRNTVRLWSVHAGAMYAPYPFANSIKEDFAGIDGCTDRFTFTRCDGNGRPIEYECNVQTWFSTTGNGFAIVQVDPVDDPPGRLSVRFFDARGPKFDQCWPPVQCPDESPPSQSAGA